MRGSKPRYGQVSVVGPADGDSGSWMGRRHLVRVRRQWTRRRFFLKYHPAGRHLQPNGTLKCSLKVAVTRNSASPLWLLEQLDRETVKGGLGIVRPALVRLSAKPSSSVKETLTVTNVPAAVIVV